MKLNQNLKGGFYHDYDNEKDGYFADTGCNSHIVF